VYTLVANKLSATGMWDEAKDCYAGALQSLVGSTSRHAHAPPPKPRRITPLQHCCKSRRMLYITCKSF
jgi:hypothetical protein